jgi:peptidoglycan-associated lipoprotein
MMSSFRSAVTAAVMVAAFSVTACGGKKPEVKTPDPGPAPAPTKPTEPPPPPPPSAPPTPTPVADRPLTEDEIYAKSTPEQLTKMGLLKPVYFSYDSVELTEEGRGILQKNAEYLKRRSTAKILIEGHADSRGTNEYNLALANRRADVVRTYIVSLGVAADRLTIVSKGEEQPFCAEETEACWQQNRVGFFVFTAK